MRPTFVKHVLELRANDFDRHPVWINATTRTWTSRGTTRTRLMRRRIGRGRRRLARRHRPRPVDGPVAGRGAEGVGRKPARGV